MNIDPHTGHTIDGWTEFVQRIHTVLTTPLHTRVKRRRFGCRLHELQGHAQTPAMLRRAAANVAAAFYHPANQLRSHAALTRVNAEAGTHGLRLQLVVQYRGSTQHVTVATHA